MPLPSDSPTRVSPKKSTDIFKQTIAMQTSASGMVLDSLLYIDELMRDPIQDPLESVIERSQPDTPTDDEYGAGGQQEAIIVKARLFDAYESGFDNEKVIVQNKKEQPRQQSTTKFNNIRNPVRLQRRLRRRLKHLSRLNRQNQLGKLKVEITELTSFINDSNRDLKAHSRELMHDNGNIVLPSEEKLAKENWERRQRDGDRTDVVTWRASNGFRDFLTHMEQTYHSGDPNRSWLEERGNIADNVEQIIEQNEDRRLLSMVEARELGELISTTDLFPFRKVDDDDELPDEIVDYDPSLILEPDVVEVEEDIASEEDVQEDQDLEVDTDEGGDESDTGNSYTVITGDSLSLISNMLWGDPMLWSLLYEHNREVVGDNPNLIFPDQVLRIPVLPAPNNEEEIDDAVEIENGSIEPDTTQIEGRESVPQVEQRPLPPILIEVVSDLDGPIKDAVEEVLEILPSEIMDPLVDLAGKNPRDVPDEAPEEEGGPSAADLAKQLLKLVQTLLDTVEETSLNLFEQWILSLGGIGEGQTITHPSSAKETIQTPVPVPLDQAEEYSSIDSKITLETGATLSYVGPLDEVKEEVFDAYHESYNTMEINTFWQQLIMGSMSYPASPEIDAAAAEEEFRALFVVEDTVDITDFKVTVGLEMTKHVTEADVVNVEFGTEQEAPTVDGTADLGELQEHRSRALEQIEMAVTVPPEQVAEYSSIDSVIELDTEADLSYRGPSDEAKEVVFDSLLQSYTLIQLNNFWQQLILGTISYPDHPVINEDAAEQEFRALFVVKDTVLAKDSINISQFKVTVSLRLKPLPPAAPNELTVSFGSGQDEPTVKIALPEIPSPDNSTVENKTGLKGELEVNSDISFTLGNADIQDELREWVHHAHMFSNDDVYFHIVRGLFTGGEEGINLASNGKNIEYGPQEGQELMELHLKERVELLGTQNVTEYSTTNYRHSFKPAQQDVTPPNPPNNDAVEPDDAVAANETARFWGDPHFVGGDGGMFDVQGEPDKTYTLLTDSGLKFEGRFDGWGQGVTVVGRTSLVLSSDGKASTVLFEPKKDIATVDGKAVTAPVTTSDGGETRKEGSDLISTTKEGYEIVQHGKGSGERRYIDSEVNTGAKGTESDGVAAGGLLGQTFDADSDRRDGNKGRGAQGEGAIDGVYTDYEVNRRSSGFNEWFYLATYEDVHDAVIAGDFSNARQHYDLHGLSEGRSINISGQSFEFDEVMYLSDNPDVARAIQNDEFVSGAQHYVTFGRFERRRKNSSGAVPTLQVEHGGGVSPGQLQLDTVPPIIPVNQDLGPNSSGIEGDLNVDSTIVFDISSWDNAEIADEWAHLNHQAGNDDVFFDIARGIRTGEHKLASGGRVLALTSKEGKEKLQEQLDERLITSEMPLISSFKINTYKHDFVPTFVPDLEIDEDLPGEQEVTPVADPVAQNEMAKFWGDPHFQGGDGGQFDVQGEPDKTYNLLTDKGLTFHGRFDGWGRGVTVVGKTHIVLSRDGLKDTIVFEPKKDNATLNGQKISSKMPTADGGTTEKSGRDLITHTAEGYKIVQHGMGRGQRQYINAEVHTGEQGVLSDGVAAGGLLGITFDADNDRRDGKKGKGAQGEGAIDGVVTDYEVAALLDPDVGEGESFPAGTWRVRVQERNAGFNQRIWIQRSEVGAGFLEGKAGKEQEVSSLVPWFVSIQNDGGKGKWKNSKLRRSGGEGKFTINSEDWRDNDFNDLIVTVELLSSPAPSPGEEPTTAQPLRPSDPDVRMSGEIEIESFADFKTYPGLANPDAAPLTFSTLHQQANDAVLDSVIDRVKTSTIETIENGKGINYSDGVAKQEIQRELEGRLPDLYSQKEVTKASVDADIGLRFQTEHKSESRVEGEIEPPAGSNTKNLKTSVKIISTGQHRSSDIKNPAQKRSIAQNAQDQGTFDQAQDLLDEIRRGEIAFVHGIVLDEASILKEMYTRVQQVTSPQGMSLENFSTQEVTAVVDFTTVDEQTMKVWEVLFDVNEGGSGGGQRIDPLIFDLNMDGQFDITGKNQEGDGEVTGPTVNFDMNPDRQSWQHNSPGHRPGTYENGRNNSRAPAIPNGYAVYDSGKRESFGPDGIWEESASKGNQAKIFNAQAKWVGEWVKDNWRAHGNVGRYYWSPVNQKEQTEWMKAGSGDGFLVWDKNNNGIIDDNTEMMSEFDKDGKKAFANGFAKLAFYFDKDNSGIVEGEELNGLKFWVDFDGDGNTDSGELQELSRYGITQIVIPGHESLDSTAKAHLETAHQKKASVGGMTMGSDDADPIVREAPPLPGEGGGTVPAPPVITGEGEVFESGSWVVEVQERNAGFSQRVWIQNTETGSGYLIGLAGKKQEVSATGPWQIAIQNDGGKGKWKNSKLRKSGSEGNYILNSEDWRDNDYNDLIIRINRVGDPTPEAPPAPEVEQLKPVDKDIRLSGEIKLDSSADFAVAIGTPNPDMYPKLFKEQHQFTNDEVLESIISRVRTGEIKTKDDESGLDFNDKKAQKEIQLGLNADLPGGFSNAEVTDATLKADVSMRFQTLFTTEATVLGEIAPPPGSDTKNLQASVKIITVGEHSSKDISQPKNTRSKAQAAQTKGTQDQAEEVLVGIQEGNIPFFNGVVLDEGAILREMYIRIQQVTRPNIVLENLSTQEVTAVVDFTTVDEQTMKVWEVLFDVDQGGSDGGQRIDPLIFDLNMDGQFDITGKNQEGDGEITGPTVNFDMNPDRQSWRHNSPGHRPGTYENGRNNSRADAIPDGYAVYDSGSRETFGVSGIWEEDASKGNQAKIFNAQAKWVGEWVKDNWRAHGQVGRYYWSPVNQEEQTEWMKAGSGDGFLVWDKNNNGLIDDNTEMMSEFDKDGKKAFANGFAKLAFYFDKDNSGIVEGEELNGLKFWVDFDGDGNTDSGELQELSKYGITQIVIPGHESLDSSAKAHLDTAHQKKTTVGGMSMGKGDITPSELEAPALPGEGGETEPAPPVVTGEGESFGAGIWVVEVQERNAGFNQRVWIQNTETGSGYLIGKAGSKKEVSSNGPWQIAIQNDGGKGKWKNSKLRKSGNDDAFKLNSEDWRDNDYNDLIVRINKIGEPEPEEGPPPETESPNSVDPDVHLSGDVELESLADSAVYIGTPNPDKASETFHLTHQEVNEAVMLDIISKVKSGEIKVKGSSIDYENSVIKDEIQEGLTPKLQDVYSKSEVKSAKLKSNVGARFQTDFVSKAIVHGEIEPPSGSNTKNLKASVTIVSSGQHHSEDVSNPEQKRLKAQSAQKHGTEEQADAVLVELQAGKIPFIGGVTLDEGAILKEMYIRIQKVTKPEGIVLENFSTQEVTGTVDFTTVEEQTMKVWEVLFDVDQGGSDGGQRIDPLIFDLNMDGQFDITGKNQEGDGEITGPTVNFDMNPDRQSWRHNSPGHRPGTYENGRNNSRADAIPDGYAVYDSGSRETFGVSGIWEEDASKGNQAKIFNAQAKWVGEWVKDNWRAHGQVGRYYWSPVNQEEQTEWMKAGSGDGFLVWDKNNNGLIDDNTEMMSEFDKDGKKAFANGFAKLAFYFDKDNSGIVEGEELNGLKFWVDFDGDGNTDSGELQELSKYGITQIVIPGHDSLDSSAQAKMDKANRETTTVGGMTMGSDDIEQSELEPPPLPGEGGGAVTPPTEEGPTAPDREAPPATDTPVAPDTDVKLIGTVELDSNIKFEYVSHQAAFQGAAKEIVDKHEEANDLQLNQILDDVRAGKITLADINELSKDKASTKSKEKEEADKKKREDEAAKKKKESDDKTGKKPKKEADKKKQKQLEEMVGRNELEKKSSENIQNHIKNMVTKENFLIDTIKVVSIDLVFDLRPKTKEELDDEAPSETIEPPPESGGNTFRQQIPPGRWTVRINKRNAEFDQRFVVSDVLRGGGVHEGREGSELYVISDPENPWFISVQNDGGQGKWAYSKLRYSSEGEDSHRVESEDWTDNDFDDLVIGIQRVTTPIIRDNVAANEMAKFWGDPHFLGGDGGKFDVQGEPNKTYNLLTDKDLFFAGRFDGWGNGVTVVGKSTLTLSSPGQKSTIIFEPKTNTATVDGQKVGSRVFTVDGGSTEMKGTDLISTTGEGYRIVQHNLGRGDRKYINAEVYTGAKGTESDGVAAGGLLGITFDDDDDSRNGKRGRGAQGEGAIEGVVTDYEVNSSGFNEDFYRATYADVDLAVIRGDFRSGLHHYQEHGMMEQRVKSYNGSSYEFDEVYYLQSYPEVAVDVANGAYRSGAHHFWKKGRAEGRTKSVQNQEILRQLNTDVPQTQEEEFARALQTGLGNVQDDQRKVSKAQMFAQIREAAQKAIGSDLSQSFQAAIAKRTGEGVPPAVEEAVEQNENTEMDLNQRQGFTGGGERHDIWMVGGPVGQPIFMMASDPKPLEEQIVDLLSLAIEKYGLVDRERVAQINELLVQAVQLAEQSALDMQVSIEETTVTTSEVTDAKASVVDLVQKALNLLNGGEVGTGENDEARIGRRLPLWQARIQAVCDPVAFMTSAKKVGSAIYKGSGNYDKGVSKPTSSDGFFEQAIAECTVIQSEILTFSGMGISDSNLEIEFESLSNFIGLYGSIYRAIQDSQTSYRDSRDASKRAVLAASIRVIVIEAQATLSSIDQSILGESAPKVTQGLTEIGVFVDAWSDLSANSEETSASPYMWASFLKTFERYRAILNYYDKLEGRGDTTGTSKMAMRRENHSTITSQEEADTFAGDRDGYLGEAMRSYGFYARDAAAYTKQVQDIISKLKAGEYDTEEACVAAFRETVGGGAASEIFYKNLEQVAKGQWKTYLASIRATLDKKAAENAKKDMSQSRASQTRSDTRLGEAKQQANSGEDNVATSTMSREQIIDLGRKVESGERTLLRKVKTLPSSASSEDQLFALGLASISAQEEAFVDYNQSGTDAAFERAMLLKGQAQKELNKAQEALDSAEENLDLSAAHALEARRLITEAEAHAHFVTWDHPALAAGTTSIHREINKIEARLGTNGEYRNELQRAHASLQAELDKRVNALADYQPDKLKIPAPTATINGRSLDLEVYGKVSVNLEAGPLWGFAYFFGGVEGEVAQSFGGKGTWTRAKIEANFGVKAKLWVLEAGVKLTGFFEAKKKDAESLPDVLSSGAEELGRWGYAWFYDLSSMASRVSGPMDNAISAGNKGYDNLRITLERGEDTQAAGRNTEAYFERTHRELTQGLITAYTNGKAELSEKDGRRMADEIIPLPDIRQGLRNIQKVEPNAQKGFITKEKQEFTKQARRERNLSLAEVKSVDPGQNDPNVQFEAGVGIEGFAGLNVGPATFRGGFQKVYSITDGEGESFDLDVQDKTIWSFNAGLGDKGSLGLKYESKAGEEGGVIEVAVNVPVSFNGGKDTSEAMQEIAKFSSGVSAPSSAALPNLAESFLQFFNKSDKFRKLFTTQFLVGELENGPSAALTSTKNSISVSVKLKADDDWNISFKSVSVGFLQKQSIGNDMAKVEVEMGSKVTYEAGQEVTPQTISDMAPNLEQPVAVKGGGESHALTIEAKDGKVQAVMRSEPKSLAQHIADYKEQATALTASAPERYARAMELLNQASTIEQQISGGGLDASVLEEKKTEAAGLMARALEYVGQTKIKVDTKSKSSAKGNTSKSGAGVVVGSTRSHTEGDGTKKTRSAELSGNTSFSNEGIDPTIKNDGWNVGGKIVNKAEKTNSDGSKQTNTDTTGGTLKGGSGALGLNLSKAWKSERASTDASGMETRRSNENKVSGDLSKDAAKVGLQNQRVTSKTKDGVTSRQTDTDSISVGTGGLSATRKKENIASQVKSQIGGGFDLTTTRGKTVTEIGSTIKTDSDGNPVIVHKASASAVAYEQSVKKSFTPFAKKIDGLSIGSRNRKAVIALQKSLNRQGASLIEDGLFGRGTEWAIKRFQRQKGLPVTGEVDEATAKSLPTVGLTGLGGTITAGYKVGAADANASLETTLTADQIKIKGVSGAKLTLIGGNAKIDLPVFGWNVGGEALQVGMTVGVNANVLAEAKGEIGLNLEKSDKLRLGVSGGGEAFAGAKAGVEIGTDLRWLRKDGSNYVSDFKDFVSSIPGRLSRKLLEQLPESTWGKVAKLLIGTGTTQILYGGVGIEGSAGIGAKGSLGAKIEGGAIEVSAALGATFGVGGSAKTKLRLHAVDGVRFLGLMGLRGLNHLTQKVAAARRWVNTIVDKLKERFDAYLETKKDEGGLSGRLAGVTDFIGDDILGLW